MDMKISLSVPLLGINWGQTINPYIAIPLRGNISITTIECSTGTSDIVNISSSEQDLSLLIQFLHTDMEKLTSLYRSLMGEEPENCYELVLPTGGVPYISIYGSTLAAIAYKLLHSAIGLKPSKSDVMELLSYLWSDKPNWLKILYESVSLSSLLGKAILYRGDDESVILGRHNLGKLARRDYYDITPVETLSDPQLESALVKLEGLSVISASNIIGASRVGELENNDFLLTYYKIDNSISYIVYGLKPPRDGCKYIQSLNGGMEEICIG
jgi:hypothetical protein